jgi:hypothetical protein
MKFFAILIASAALVAAQKGTSTPKGKGTAGESVMRAVVIEDTVDIKL